MDLLIAGIVLFLLFAGTYSQRRTWITLGSTALTIVLIGGGVIVSTAQTSTADHPARVHDGLAQLAKRLPAGWDRPALQLTTAIEQASAGLARLRTEAASEPQPVLTASIADWFSFGSWFKSETETDESAAPDEAPEAEAEPAAGTGADMPIKWFLDAPAASETFAVRGANISDQPLKVVRAVLKPDSGAGKVKLKLAVDGQDGTADVVIPPGARFRIEADGLTASEAEAFGGAILSFAYVQAGRRKSAIMYLTPAVLAQDGE